MSCGFIDKYKNKLYTGEMNYLDNKVLNHHMDSCIECSEIYGRIMRGNSVIRESVLDVEVPASLTFNVSRGIDEKSKNRRPLKVRRYIAAAVMLLVIVSASIFYITRINGGFKVTPGGIDQQNNTVNTDTKTSNQFEDIIRDYIIEKEGYITMGGKVFVSMDIFGSELEGDTVKVYLWALIEEYAWVQGLTQGSGSSLPMVIELEKSGDTYVPKSLTIPRDGTFYPEDIKKMFPGGYRDKVSARQGNVYDLQQKNKQEAMEYFKDSTTPQASLHTVIENFLDKYGWHYTDNGKEYVQDIKIPLTFVDKPGEIPIGLYFAYNNVFSKHIGYDLKRYQGMDAKAHIIPLAEQFGDGPNKNVRAIIIEVNGSISGAWLDRGRSGFLCSLDKKYFAEILDKPWNEWLIDEGLVDYSPKGSDGSTKSLTPEEIINKYYDAIANKDYKTAFALQSKSNQMGYLYINMDDRKLFNDDYDSYYGGLQNILSVKVAGITKWQGEYAILPDKMVNRQGHASAMYKADTMMEFKEEIVRINGENPWFIGMVKESSDAPWLIEGIGTGP